MWLTVLAAIAIAVCIAAGAWSGALATGLRIATLVLAYAASVWCGPALVPEVGALLGLGGLVANLVSGSVVFAIAYVLLAITAHFARRLTQRKNSDRSPRDRFLGAMFGAVRGAALALLLVYTAMWFDAL